MASFGFGDAPRNALPQLPPEAYSGILELINKKKGDEIMGGGGLRLRSDDPNVWNRRASDFIDWSKVYGKNYVQPNWHYEPGPPTHAQEWRDFLRHIAGPTSAAALSGLGALAAKAVNSASNALTPLNAFRADQSMDGALDADSRHELIRQGLLWRRPIDYSGSY